MVSPLPLSSNPLGQQLVESMWIQFAILTFVLALRLYARVFLVRAAAWDDLLMVIAFFVNLGAFILSHLAVNYGFGVHTNELDPHNQVEALKWAFLGQVLGILAAGLARIAFICTLSSLLAQTQRLQLWLLRGFLVVQVIVNAVMALYILLQCKPISGLWSHGNPGECLPPYIHADMGFVQGSINSFTDLALAIFPATVIWKLNMKTSLKVSLCVTMGLGVFAFVTSLIKTIKINEIDANADDLTYAMFGLQFWFCIENATLIVSATLPTLRPLFRKVGFSGSYYRSSNSRWNDDAEAAVGPKCQTDEIPLTPSRAQFPRASESVIDAEERRGSEPSNMLDIYATRTRPRAGSLKVRVSLSDFVSDKEYR